MTDQERIAEIHRRTRESVDRMLAEYGANKEHLEIRHWEKLDSILDASSPKEALERSEQSIQKVHTTILVLLATSKILGRNPRATFEKKARREESRARSLQKAIESKFTEPDDLPKLKKRLEKTREKALEFWKNSGLEPPQEIVFTDEEIAEADAEVAKEKKAKKSTPKKGKAA